MGGAYGCQYLVSGWSLWLSISCEGGEAYGCKFPVSGWSLRLSISYEWVELIGVNILCGGGDYICLQNDKLIIIYVRSYHKLLCYKVTLLKSHHIFL